MIPINGRKRRRHGVPPANGVQRAASSRPLVRYYSAELITIRPIRCNRCLSLWVEASVSGAALKLGVKFLKLWNLRLNHAVIILRVDRYPTTTPNTVGCKWVGKLSWWKVGGWALLFSFVFAGRHYCKRGHEMLKLTCLCFEWSLSEIYIWSTFTVASFDWRECKVR